MEPILSWFDLNETYPEAAELLARFEYPWEALDLIEETIKAIGARLSEEEFDHPAEDVWIAKDAVVAPTAFIKGPAIIGHGTEVRHCAFIRGKALVGNGCVVGNSTELKNVILFNRVQVPHFNYVGDSILGYHAHFGAGAVTSNVKSDHKNITIRIEGEAIETGRRKIGAMVGDGAEIGCNAVLNPGTLVGKQATVYPTTCARGVIPANTILKNNGMLMPKRVSTD